MSSHNIVTDKGATHHFDYYSPVTVEAAEHSFLNETIQPINGVENENIEFAIEPYEDLFICMQNISFNADLEITSSDPADVGQIFADVALCNDSIASLWKQITVKLNGVDITGNGGRWPGFKSYIEHIFSCKSLISGPIEGRSLCHDDLKNDLVTSVLNTNYGHLFRRNLVRNNKISVNGRLPIDLFNSTNFLAPGNKIEISLQRQSDEFVLKAPIAQQNPKKYQLQIRNMSMDVYRLRLNPRIPRIISPSATQYYITSFSSITPMLVKKNTQNFVANISRGGVIPKQVIMGFVQTKTFHGTYNKQPYNFHHANVSRVNLRLNNTSIPNEALEMDWDRQLIERYITHVYRNTGKYQRGSIYFTKNDFMNGYALFPFDLRPDKCNGLHLHAGRTGNLDAEFMFKNGLEEDFMLIIYSFFDQVITIDPQTSIPKTEIF